MTETAKEQARQVARTSQEQVRDAARRMSGQVRDEAHSQTNRLAHGLRDLSDDLAAMSSNGRSDSPARGLVEQAAQGGRQAADWLERRGLDGLLAEARSFARRRPGTFLLGAAIAGFAVGRLAKATPTETTPTETTQSEATPVEAPPAQPETLPRKEPGGPEGEMSR